MDRKYKRVNMEREKEILQASVCYNESIGELNVIGGDSMLSEEEYYSFNKNPHFIAGAKWADEHPHKMIDNIEYEE